MAEQPVSGGGAFADRRAAGSELPRGEAPVAGPASHEENRVSAESADRAAMLAAREIVRTRVADDRPRMLYSPSPWTATG
ncbi:MAG TPA: hypothetical protein VHF87_08780 [Methylomirabilota bacterium]|jgi:hypothetical protein|nr:hypothetical protein [Methylomirabilota bacterium]